MTDIRPQAEALIAFRTEWRALRDKWRKQANEVYPFARSPRPQEDERTAWEIAARLVWCSDDLETTCLKLEAILVPSPPVFCATCQGRGWIMTYESHDYGNGLGSGGSGNAPCPDCAAVASPPTPEKESVPADASPFIDYFRAYVERSAWPAGKSFAVFAREIWDYLKARESAGVPSPQEPPDFRTLYEELVNRIANGHPQSIGSINNVRMVQFGIDEIARMREPLAASRLRAPQEKKHD